MQYRSGLNKLGLMIYITITDHRHFCFAETFIKSQTELFKIKPFRARKVMPKAWCCLTDPSEFLPSQGLQNSLRFLYVSEITFLTYLIKLLETKSFQSLEGSDRKDKCFSLFIKYNFTKLPSELVWGEVFFLNLENTNSTQ